MYYHNDPVYGVNVHPEDSNVFLTASDDGKVLLWDIRTSPLSGMTWFKSIIIVKYDIHIFKLLMKELIIHIPM